MLEKDGEALLSDPELSRTVSDLRKRINSPASCRVAERMVEEIMKKEKVKNPMDMRAEDFNQSCEHYLREDLRKKQMAEGMTILEEELFQLDLWALFRDPACKDLLFSILEQGSASDFFALNKNSLLDETAKEDVLAKMIQLIVLTVGRNMELPI
ncbi:hypothetical protein MTBBW1_710018 [Desulfamplus magnetovallimortis]|uniref:Uncharacterized protein n=1 Tax=Desulfamplus magnetovallimortis TaxID=1246637 RepID=A0A1W1HJ75_9BACT|nr:hypothetical protein [Desulfamplus magnetovallimortis]SLM32418.1 hypothetical protein MTBBW1_710018 [Desulfamplus magnetovallimortis]